MQIVITIDDKDCNDIMTDSLRNLNHYERLIKNGTPLPKGHGDIIDRSKIEYMRAIHDLKWGKITASECSTRIKYSAPTIIEASKEQEDGT